MKMKLYTVAIMVLLLSSDALSQKLIDVKNVIYIKKLREYYKKYNIKFYYTPAHKSAPDPRKDPDKYKLWYGNYMADHLARSASSN